MERVTIVNGKRRRRLKPKDESRSVKKKWVSPAVTWCHSLASVIELKDRAIDLKMDPHGFPYSRTLKDILPLTTGGGIKLTATSTATAQPRRVPLT